MIKGDTNADGAVCAVVGGGVRVGCKGATVSGKKFHGDRLKLLAEVCEKWVLFEKPWNTKFVNDAHALIDLGLLVYLRSDNGFMCVQPTELGLVKFKTIVSGVFGEDVATA